MKARRTIRGPERAAVATPDKSAQAKARERLLLDPEWRFHSGDLPLPAGHEGWVKDGNFRCGAVDPSYDDSAWRVVDLPHDFVVEGEFTRHSGAVADELKTKSGLVFGDSLFRNHGYLPSGVGWYRKTFAIPSSDLGRRLSVEFDGVARDCTVWMNGHFLGRHLSGYTGFRFDVTDIVHYGGSNTLAIRVDASEYEGWFYEGGGIYRHVWLVKHAAVHVDPQGVVVTTEDIGHGACPVATVRVQTTVRNDSGEDVAVRLVSTALNPEGKSAGSVEANLSVPAHGEISVEQTLEIPRPALWSVESPNLYTLLSAVHDAGGSTDELRTVFGIRTIGFDAERGFFLNGRPLKLKGMCCHQDHAGVGVALPDRLQEFRIERLKAMGCNAYRSSHNPATPELLDACDRLGMLVMAENRILGSSPEILGQLAEMVRRDRNHPSIILWSLANEESALQGTETGARIAATMKRTVRRFDRSRPVTMAMNGHWGEGISGVVDVQGCNYIQAGDIDEFHRKFPDQPIVFTESASQIGTRGEYAHDPIRCYVSAYDEKIGPSGPIPYTAEENWKHCLSRPFISGTFVWTGFDYRGEPNPYEWPAVGSQYGVIDICGFPKDAFYYYKAWWSSEPVLHLFPHWNWPGREGQPIEVWAYTNCEEVELALNGQALGRRKVETATHVSWTVPYAPGTLTARGWRGGKLVLTATVETTGAPAAVRLLPDRATIKADGEDLSMVTVQVVDRQGRVVPTAENEIIYTALGAGKILGVGSGHPSSHESDKSDRRRVFNGHCQVIVQAARESGGIQLEAVSAGLEGGVARIKTEPCEPRQAVFAVSAAATGFACSSLQPAPDDIHDATPPVAGTAFHKVTTVRADGFCDIREFHKRRDGFVLIRATFVMENAGTGVLLYGADGPVRVWVNGTAVDCRPEARNPAVKDGFKVDVAWKAGENVALFGLQTNGGKAWGVFARALPAASSKK